MCSLEDAVACRALLAAQEAVLVGGHGLDEGPEVLEGDVLAVTNTHLTQDLAEALLRSNALWTRRHKHGHVLPSGAIQTGILLESLVPLSEELMEAPLLPAEDGSVFLSTVLHQPPRLLQI